MLTDEPACVDVLLEKEVRWLGTCMWTIGPGSAGGSAGGDGESLEAGSEGVELGGACPD